MELALDAISAVVIDESACSATDFVAGFPRDAALGTRG